ncbi:MAG: heterodisulfide reductase subunit C [Deltaproteobacteria bacterium]|nr:heterodisulfide reductase subunit C [Deltaproteobacteria bacterium]
MVGKGDLRADHKAGPPVIEASRGDRGFLEEVVRRSGVQVRRCFQCRTCSGGCPFVQAMDYPPNVLLRLLLYGRRRQVLSCGTIWLCVSCNTCSSQCPMALDLSAVMETLRIMALKARAPIGRPNILEFHEEVARSLERYGRTHKLGIMLRYKLLTGSWFSDLDVGLKMFAKRKLELFPSRIKQVHEVARVFEGQLRRKKK